MEYYSAITKNKIMPLAATWMDLEIAMLNEESWEIKHPLYVESKKKWYKWIYLQQTQNKNGCQQKNNGEKG